MQLCNCSVIAAIDNMATNEHYCVPIKLYLWTVKLEFGKIFSVTTNFTPFPCPNHSKLKGLLKIDGKPLVLDNEIQALRVDSS